MLNIFCFDHPLNKVVEYRFFILGAVQSVAELIEISVNIRMAYPGVSCSNPRFYSGASPTDVSSCGEP
ncbi:MAG: hypothetical protein ACI81T_004695 [Bacteroidia bacterium]|jgi:hypothetical protein